MTGSPANLDDREWLRLLYEANRNVVFRYASSRVGRDEAMDVVADTFVEAGRNRHKFAPTRGSESAWLLGIATNMIRRSIRGRGEGDPSEAVDLYGAEDADTVSLPGRIDAERQAEDVRRAIESLPEGERAAIVLHAVEGLEIREVARALRISGTAAKVRIFRARRRLRDLLPHLNEMEGSK